MKIEEMQRRWKTTTFQPKTEDELQKMLDESNPWRFRQLTNKEHFLLTLAVLYFAILIVEGFKGYIAFSGVWAFALLVDNYFGLRNLRFLPQEPTLRATLVSAMKYIKRRQAFSYAGHVFMWMILTYLMGTSNDGAGLSDVLWVATVTTPALAFTIWETRKAWAPKNNIVKADLRELTDEPSHNMAA